MTTTHEQDMIGNAIAFLATRPDLEVFVRDFNDENTGFSFSSDPRLDDIANALISDGHSGASFALVLRECQRRLVETQHYNSNTYVLPENHKNTYATTEDNHQKTYVSTEDNNKNINTYVATEDNNTYVATEDNNTYLEYQDANDYATLMDDVNTRNTLDHDTTLTNKN